MKKGDRLHQCIIWHQQKPEFEPQQELGFFLTFPQGEKKEGRLESTHVFLHVQYKNVAFLNKQKRG